MDQETIIEYLYVLYILLWALLLLTIKLDFLKRIYNKK